MQNTTKATEDGGFRGTWQLHWRWYLAFTVAGFALRLFFVFRFPILTPDGIVYGDLAKNWLLHHVYGLSGPQGPAPTLIRLPGYPALLAMLWTAFGADHYNAVRFAQVIVDIGTCFVTADLARRICPFSDQQARLVWHTHRWAFALAAVCPFLSNYTAVPLTETPAVFLSALSGDLAVAALQRDGTARGASLSLWAGCGLAIAAAIYLRPDNGVLLIAIGGYLLYRLACKLERSRTFWAGVVLGACALLPLAPWTVRNWRVFHRVQPLAPTHAEEAGEFPAYGFDHWMRTWVVDYASLEDIAFRMDGEEMDVNTLPGRAFDDAGERRKTEELFDAYNENVTVTPELDAQFEQLARQRIQRHPLRHNLVLPLLRAADLWLRPRAEMLPIDAHWWRWRNDPRDFGWSLLLAAINIAYLGLALLGALRWRGIRYAPMLGVFLLARTVVVIAITYPEPRYVLECYPVVIAFAAVYLSGYRFSGRTIEESQATAQAVSRGN